MKSQSTIQLEFQQVRNQAKALEGCADKLDAARRSLKSLMQELQSCWAGDAAQAYLEKCDELAVKLNNSSKDLDRVANVIHVSAKAYRDAELAALALIKNK